MLAWLRDWRRRRWLSRYPLPDTLWRQATADLPVLQSLATRELSRLRALTTIFLQEKTFVAVHELELDDVMRARIAVQACLPVLHLDLDWYLGWETLVVYPGRFRHRRKEMDEDGLVHEWDQVMSGEAWEQGPVILSWADVEISGYREGYNVIIHELAHKLDMCNGVPDGFPPLHHGMDVQAWTRAFSTAFADLNRRLDAGEPTPIDPYAAEDPAEFFAVLSEYFFELPGLLQEVYPDVYAQLQAFYRGGGS